MKSENFNKKEEKFNLDFFKNLPYGLQNKLDSSWDITDDMDQERINNNLRDQLNILLPVIQDKLQGEDKKDKVNAGRVLFYIRREFDDYVSDKEESKDESNDLSVMKERLDNLWLAFGGKEANEMYKGKENNNNFFEKVRNKEEFDQVSREIMEKRRHDLLEIYSLLRKKKEEFGNSSENFDDFLSELRSFSTDLFKNKFQSELEELDKLGGDPDLDKIEFSDDQKFLEEHGIGQRGAGYVVIGKERFFVGVKRERPELKVQFIPNDSDFIPIQISNELSGLDISWEFSKWNHEITHFHQDVFSERSFDEKDSHENEKKLIMELPAEEYCGDDKLREVLNLLVGEHENVDLKIEFLVSDENFDLLDKVTRELIQKLDVNNWKDNEKLVDKLEFRLLNYFRRYIRKNRESFGGQFDNLLSNIDNKLEKFKDNIVELRPTIYFHKEKIKKNTPYQSGVIRQVGEILSRISQFDHLDSQTISAKTSVQDFKGGLEKDSFLGYDPSVGENPKVNMEKYQDFVKYIFDTTYLLLSEGVSYSEINKILIKQIADNKLLEYDFDNSNEVESYKIVDKDLLISNIFLIINKREDLLEIDEEVKKAKVLEVMSGKRGEYYKNWEDFLKDNQMISLSKQLDIQRKYGDVIEGALNKFKE